MKKLAIRMLIILSFGIALAIPSFAAQMEHGSMKGAEAKDQTAEARHGQKIREAKAEGYQFEYYLIDMKQMMGGKTEMKGHDMAEMKSHHLMVYLKDADGKYVQGAKVGFWLTGPDGKDQKTMAMSMGEGFGADIDLKAKGAYKIKTKAVVGDKTLVDEFTYNVK